MNSRDAEGAEKGRADMPVRPYGTRCGARELVIGELGAGHCGWAAVDALRVGADGAVYVDRAAPYRFVRPADAVAVHLVRMRDGLHAWMDGEPDLAPVPAHADFCDDVERLATCWVTQPGFEPVNVQPRDAALEEVRS